MDVFKNFKAAVKIRQVLLDSQVSQLHYRVTALLLLGCAALVASKQHFGDPIECITKDDVPNKIMDTYCWIHSTFTLPGACNKTVGIEVAHPCVDKFVHDREERIYHKYYQWVYFVLFFQAACFYAPHYFWKMCEAKLLTNLTKNLKNPLFKEADKRQFEIKLVAQYLTRNRTRFQTYFYYFTFFEVINLLNVIMQIYLVDEFLGGTFTTYGLDVLNYVQLNQWQRVDPMVRVFPRMTKCTFHRFGSSGDVQKYDSLCILPLNIINEKIYVVMWFWFVFLAIVTGGWLIYRLLTHVNPQLRYKILHRRASLASPRKLKHVLLQLETGDWFLLSMMCKNMDSLCFKDLIIHLNESLSDLEMKNGRKNYVKKPNNFNGPHSGKEPIMDSEDSDNDLELKQKINDSANGSTLEVVMSADDNKKLQQQ